MAGSLAWILIAGAAILALGSCGNGDEPATTTTVVGTTGPTGASGPSGASAAVSAEEVESCLRDEGLDAAVGDGAVVGLEAIHQRVDVAIEDLEHGAVVIVFDRAEAAAAEEVAAGAAAGVAEITVAGNTIWGIDASVDDPERAEAAIEACLPA